MPKKPAPKPLWIKIVSWTFYSVLCVFALLAGTAAGWVSKSDTAKALLLGTIGMKQPPAQVFKTHMFTILVLGCDEDRTTGGAKITQDKARSDMMLLAQVDFDKKLVTGLSIPRDIRIGFGKYHPAQNQRLPRNRRK